MTQWTLKPLQATELASLYARHIEKDFPSNERPNLAAMRRHISEGLQTIWLMTDGQQDAAYAVCAEANDITLVTLLAVFPQMRGSGCGSALMGLLAQKYKHARAIVLEVEDPQDAPNDDDRITRRRRIAFYERNGYQQLPGVRHESFGVALLLMAHPLSDTFDGVLDSAVTDMRTVYHRILPEHLWPRVITSQHGEGPPA